MSLHLPDTQVQKMHVAVETKSELSAGQTVCDVWHHSKEVCETLLCMTEVLLPSCLKWLLFICCRKQMLMLQW